jgi:hypothetical protein
LALLNGDQIMTKSAVASAASTALNSMKMQPRELGADNSIERDPKVAWELMAILESVGHYPFLDYPKKDNEVTLF